MTTTLTRPQLQALLDISAEHENGAIAILDTDSDGSILAAPAAADAAERDAQIDWILPSGEADPNS